MTLDDLIADWKQMGDTLVSQLQLLESGRLDGGGAQGSGGRTADTIARLKRFITELDAMIGERGP